MPVIVLSSLLIGAAAIAAFFDIRTGRIRNGLTYGVAVLALVSHAFFGPIEFAVSLLCMAAVLAACLPIFASGWLRGGDVKMIVACAGIVSVHYLVPFLLYTMLAGGFVSIAVALRHGSLRQSLAAVGAAAHPLLHGIVPRQLPHATHKVPYGLAILGGAILTVLSMIALPGLRLL